MSTKPALISAAGPPLKVCMLAACPFPANHGTPGSIRELAEGVAGHGHEVHIVTYHFGEDIPVKGPRIHRIPAWTGESAVVVGPTSRRPLYDLQMVFKTLQVLRDYRCDVMHAHGYEAALVAGLCRLASGVPFVYSGHNTMADELPSYRFIRPQWLARGLARFLDVLVPRLGDRCLPHSANMERFFRDMGLAARTEPAVPFGINCEELAGGNGAAVRRRYRLGQDPVVLYAGVLDEFQRLDLLLEAMRPVRTGAPGAKLLVVVTIPHEGHVARLRARAEELGVADRLVLTEPQPLAEVPNFLAACDVAVVPRPQAPGFPIKLLNYMAAGRPSVLFASSASSGMVHGANVFLAAPDTGAALGEALLAVLKDAPLRQRLGQGGLHFVRERHDRSRVAEQICQVYYRALAGVGRSASGFRRKKVVERPALPERERIVVETEARRLGLFPCPVGV